ncbi:MAG TPA: tetratricopeptide repeat protein, partial [Anaerolineales bacterium]|nr:tetratricopeptide repeat protein [Anaerolineales bacterium]
AEVKYLLSATRLLTLIGPGGTGKTRLSMQVAGELLAQYPDGAWFVEFAPISDPSLVASTTAAALNLPAEVHRPAIDMLCDYLREKELLLLLDNCEHLVSVCARMADRLLHAAPKLRMIASSREALGIAGEASYRVPSLGLPDLKNLSFFESLSQYEAVRLFIDRATSAVSTFSVTNENAPTIAQICHRLDGIPLAIELAAVKVRVLSLEQIAERLDDRFRLLTSGSRTALERHQTLRATLDWSYNLLSPEEQILFRRLSIFVNGWTLEAAESVCSDESTSGRIRSDDVLNLLEHLVNKSLVTAEEWQSETRYRVLETMRQYAGEKLIEVGESESLRERHLEYYLKLAETADPHLLKPEQIEWLNRLEAEHENMRAALEWSLGKERPEYALRLATALGTFWHIHCYWIEGAKWLASALAKPAQDLTATEQTSRARALYHDAELAQAIDNIERMRISAEASLALCGAGTDLHDLAIARFYVGFAFFCIEDNNHARPLLEQSLVEFREMKDLYWEALTRRWHSNILIKQGERSRGESGLSSLEIARRAGERLHLAEVLTYQADFAWSINQFDEAEGYLKESEMLHKQIGYRGNSDSFVRGLIAYARNDFQQARLMYIKSEEQFKLLGEKNIRSAVLQYLGVLEMDDGNFQQAQSYLEEALKIAKEVEIRSWIVLRLAMLGQIEFLQGNLEGAKRNFNESLSIGNKIDDRYSKYDPLLIFSNTYANLQPQITMRILGAIHTYYRNKIKDPIHPFRKRENDSVIAQARQRLDESAFNAAWAEGEKMSLDEAIELALKTLDEL